tara:strand:- start:1092 stop:2081 length:990 start_codon:yes stop_codon:yes gene_type:complete
MALQDYTKLKGVNDVGDSLFMSTLENNLKVFFDWGLLGIGAWFDVQIPQSGVYGGYYHKLRRVDDPSYDDGQVWETPRKDLVWETGVSYPSGLATVQPVRISGVYVDGTNASSFYGPGDSTYSHHINYPLGRVVFDTAIDTSSDIYMNYSYRWVQTYLADKAPWWQELQYGSFRVDGDHISQTGSGDWSIGGNHRVQLPAVVIEAVPRRYSQGYELGNSSLRTYQDVLFHVIAESKWQRNQLVDILSVQQDKTIYLFDTNKVAEDRKYPLDYRGMLASGNPLMYPNLVAASGYRWKECRFRNSVLSEVESPSPNLHEAVVRTTFEVVIS